MTVTDYINFCVENIVPTREVHCFPNNKLWITTELKEFLNKEEEIFRVMDKEDKVDTERT